MSVRVVHANPRVGAHWDRVAIQRGPIIYGLEGIGQKDVSVFDIVMPLNQSGNSHGFQVKFEPDFLGGIVTITSNALKKMGPIRNGSV